MILTGAMVLSAAACSKDDSDETTGRSRDEEVQEETQPDIIEDEPGEGAPDYDAQLEVLKDCFDQWYTESYGSEGFHYAVTDLDCDGRLEIIAASCQGSGNYTWAGIFEVNDDVTGIDLLDDNRPEGYDYPDIITDYFEYYEQDGIRYYVVNNYTSMGAFETSNETDLMYLQDDIVNIVAVCDVFESDAAGYIYYDGDYNSITEEEFNDIVNNIGGDCLWDAQSIGWVEIADGASCSTALAGSWGSYQQPAVVAVG